MSGKFAVRPEHGRVFKPTDDPLIRVLVAIPGDEISVELARECGLIPDEPVKAPSAKKAAAPAKKATAKAAEEPAPKVASYPTKSAKS